jgi:CheY-like chemotaxis protein
MTRPPIAKTVLIANGAAAVRDRFRSALEDAGHRAVLVETSAGLVERLQTDTPSVDLIVLDLRLPPGSGMGLVRSIRELSENRIPLLIFSGTVAGAEEVRTLAALGIAGYVNEHSAPPQILPSIAPHLFADNFNRRGSPRAILEIPVQCRFGNTIAAALTLNLSHSGIAIRTTSPLDNASTLEVRFRLPGLKHDIDAEGHVVWGDRRAGMGLQFDTIDPNSQIAIDSFLDAHFFSNRKT